MADLDGSTGYDNAGNSFPIPAPVMGGDSSPWPFLAVGAASRIGNAVSQSNAIAAQGAYASAHERTNAQLATMSAHDALVQGDWQASQIEKASRQRAAKTVAASGSQGVTAGSLAPMAVSEQESGSIDALQAKANAYKKAFGFNTEAVSNTTAARLGDVATKNSEAQTLLTGGLQAIQGSLSDFMTYTRSAELGRYSAGGMR